ncbi:Na+/H+ antiporter subunit E [Tistrella sp.]|uniref:Na+/H+ antiporter subunit E n=1 Tax=Tistrella sp. TaxID=2024861 RepID=UPI0025E2F9FE|nr:Na+/H+ antiporter subunit E [Tistrella sp.]
MARAFGLFLALLTTWLLMSGIYKPLIIGFGVLSCAFSVWIARWLGILDREGAPLGMLPRAIPYWFWLSVEIIKSNIDVFKRVWGLAPIDPAWARVPTSQTTDLGRVIYAQSITLTPGTVSVDFEGGMIVAHALHSSALEGMGEGEMDRRCTALEGRV